MDLLEFCQKLPKVELHAHLNGSLSENTLIALGAPNDCLNSYQIINANPDATKEKLNECFKLFKVAHSATSTVNAVYTATKHVIEEFHKDNVIYLELRTTPRQEHNMTKKQYVEAVVRAINDNQNPIIVKLILSIDRSHDLKVSQEALDLIIDMNKQYPDVIKGIDLCGNPSSGIFNGDLFVKARENHLNITLHCGEVKNDDEVIRMLKFKPERIGHATCVHTDYGGSEEIWKLYQTLAIPIECCLTSNVMCGTSESYKKHHIREWLKNDLPFCISTDDKGVFNTSLSKEYFYVAENFNLSRELLLDSLFKAVCYSFASQKEKMQLEKLLQSWMEENRNLLN